MFLPILFIVIHTECSRLSSEQSAAWPPCVRVIVLSSEHLQPGSLQIITCDGATFGRDENYGHMFVMSDDKVSEASVKLYPVDLGFD